MEVNEHKVRNRSEVSNKTNCYENAKEVNAPRKLDTINQNLEGKCHPETGVKFERCKFTLNGEKVEGVFPVFDSAFDCRIPKSEYKAGRGRHRELCNAQLKKAVETNPDIASRFTPEQIKQIKNGDTPRGYEWHHHQIPARDGEVRRHARTLRGDRPLGDLHDDLRAFREALLHLFVREPRRTALAALAALAAFAVRAV